MAESMSATISRENILFKIFSSAGLIVVLTLLVKAVAMGKEMLVAHRFGVGDELDCFLMAYLLPQFLVNVVAGAFSFSFVPILSESIQQNGMAHARKVLREALSLLIGVLLLSVFLLFWLLPSLLPVVASGFSAEKLAQSQGLSYFLLPVILLNGLSVFSASVLNTRHHYAMPALLPVMTPLAIVIVLVNFTELGIKALIVGTLIGVLIELSCFVCLLRKADWYVLPTWRMETPEIHGLLKQYSHRITAVLLMSGTTVVDQSMAAMDMLPAGSVAALGYGNKLVYLVLGLGGTAVGTVLLSHYSELVAKQDWQLIKNVTRKIQQIIFLVSTLIVGILIFFSDEIVTLLFQRGNFTENDVAIVSRIQVFYLLQIPFYLMAMVGGRLLTAMGRADVLTKITFVNMILNIAGNIVFMKWLGVAGIALSTSLMCMFSYLQILLFFSIIRKNNQITRQVKYE